MVKEVSCKVLAGVVREAERKKLGPNCLTEGTAYDLTHLRDPRERIDWQDFIQIMANARKIWTEEEMIDIGKRVAASRLFLSLALIARLLFTPKDFYFYLNKGNADGGGGMFFTNMTPTIRETGRNELEIELLTADGYSLCREFYLITLGAFTVVPALLGLPPAEITMSDVPRGMRYQVKYPPGGGVLRRILKALSWPFTAHAVARQLMESNEVLEKRYQDIERARIALAAQATKLRTAHTVGQLVQENLDLDLTVEAITKALVKEAGFAHAIVEIDTTLDELVIRRSHESGSRGQESGAQIAKTLQGRSGHILGRVVATAKGGRNEDVAEREELLSFIVPTIAMALDDAISYVVVEEYRRGLEERVKLRTTELSEARDALAVTVKDLEAAKEARDRIFANINHDLRSPLTLILLTVDEARRTNALMTDAGVQTLAGIEHGARRVLRMVDELLILAEGREGDVRLRRVDCDLGAMTKGVAHAWQSAATAAGLTLSGEVQAGVTFKVHADANALERILANLVSNAIKFTPRGGTIKVRLQRSEDERSAILEVEDNGPGIDDDLKKRLFGRFERGARAAGNAISGSGLGLSLVKELAEAHGGSVRVEDAPGGGACFHVELPLERRSSTTLAPSAAAAGTTTQLRPQDYGIKHVTPDSDLLPTYYNPPTGVTPRATILIAEDDPDLRDRTAKLLATDYRVIAAPDGAAALDLARQHNPDILLTDVQMPRMDGIELTRRFRQLPNNRLAPVLVLTTFGAVRDKLSGFDAGAVDYIHKPFEPDELRARVKSQLTLRSLALQLLETEKLAALGTLSAGLAHEIRNPANGIINAVAPLKELLPPEAIAPGTAAGQLLDIVEHCSKQVAAMSRQLLGFKRNVEPKRQPIPIDRLISRVLTTAKPSLEGVELRERLDYKGDIHCAEPLIAQVLTNLVQNGAHAAGTGGWVEVETKLDEAKVVVEVRDSGPGVPEELRERIFEPFFTTKPAGSGTGLGLSTARDIVLRHGGSLDVRSASGRTVFRVEIPVPS